MVTSVSLGTKMSVKRSQLTVMKSQQEIKAESEFSNAQDIVDTDSDT